ncbi:paREP10 [Pyrobaculum aerophilum str. IM2]|uniref:PaREP10 n=3 Tax=Pyrobaculum aerophilum TaxID=13773 RepID=Q8ZYS4_PYRAE|nr:paREP10 [Pyrobaculum aerophilum str. IM2]
MLSATEHFLNWMYGIYMPSLQSIMGPHVYALQKYGVSPADDINTALAKLQKTAPHLASLLREIAYRNSFSL